MRAGPAPRRVALTPHGQGADASCRGVKKMAELDFDPNQFAPANGIWHIIDRNSVGDPERVMRSLVVGKASGDRWYVVAFTDSDLAEQFIKRSNLPDAVPLPFLNQQAWLDFLEKLPERAYEYIGFDPEPNGKFADFGTIVDLISRIREALSGP